MAKDLILEAQKRGITLSEDEDGSWHGSYINDGQEYTLDNESLEGLADDMNALADILEQDDTYTVDYNEDADRYLVHTNGFATPFSNQVLAKAYAAAKDAVMAKMAKEEADRKAREPKPEPAPKAPRAAKGNGDKPAPAPASQGAAVATGDLPLPVADAIVRLINALTDLVAGATHKANATETIEPIEPAPKQRKKGLGKSA